MTEYLDQIAAAIKGAARTQRPPGDNAAMALADVLRGIGYDPDAVVVAVQGERKTKLLEELASIRKRAEAQGVTKGEWEAVEPKLVAEAEVLP